MATKYIIGSKFFTQWALLQSIGTDGVGKGSAIFLILWLEHTRTTKTTQ